MGPCKGQKHPLWIERMLWICTEASLCPSSFPPASKLSKVAPKRDELHGKITHPLHSALPATQNGETQLG